MVRDTRATNLICHKLISMAKEPVKPMMRIAARLFVGGVKQSEERLEIDPDKDGQLAELAERHSKKLLIQPGYVEIEFLDEPDFSTRFFRMGTSPDGMLVPIEVDLTRPFDFSMWGPKPS